ncbi:MAG: branched chain amino acid aminotransferase, partial [Flavobacteriaceae bacterium]|nr:branched chain amino acid aminotransferase [Flavobacteriaceae bacterium]
MSNQIKITRIKESNISKLDFDNIPLGTTFTDHMFMC